MIKNRVELDAGIGILITDDYNPMEIWEEDMSNEWRRTIIKGMGEEILLN